ncbi:MAG TPA: hypothetical protein VN730_01645 [Steroidobacteraceae bacterium]|nr:hypothetical protein [Steroidobacteraceae bacterium]
MVTTSLDARPGAALSEHPVMRWGAVFAGWFVATGTALGLYAFGLAVGFSAIDPHDAAAVAHGVSAGTIVWLILTWGASLWIGAMFASWFDGRNDTEMGVIRGLTVWGLSMTAAGLLVARGLARIGSDAAASAAGPPIDPTLLAHYVAGAMWTAFGCTVLSLLASVFGGWLGARHVQHVYHLRKYAPHGQ